MASININNASNTRSIRGLNNNLVESLNRNISSTIAITSERSESNDDDVIIIDDDSFVSQSSNANRNKRNETRRKQEEALRNDEIFARRLQADLDREYFQTFVNNGASNRSSINSSRNLSEFNMPNDVSVSTSSLSSGSTSRLPITRPQTDALTSPTPTRRARTLRTQPNLQSTSITSHSNINRPTSRNRTTSRSRLINNAQISHARLNANIESLTSLTSNSRLNGIEALLRTNSNRNVRILNNSNNTSLIFDNRDFNSNDYERLLRLDELHTTKKGLSQNELNQLPSFEFKGLIDDQDENCRTCYICYDLYEKDEVLTALTCYHKFHKNCIEIWLKESRKCPLCKKDAILGS